MFNNPLEHDCIKVEDAIKIDANHLIVVYKQLADNSVQRRIVQGPTLFVPDAGEWYVDICSRAGGRYDLWCHHHECSLARALCM